MPALCRQAVMPRPIGYLPLAAVAPPVWDGADAVSPARLLGHNLGCKPAPSGGVNLVPGHRNRGLTAFFFVFSLAQLSKHRPACCRHSFASGNWSCSRLLPSGRGLVCTRGQGPHLYTRTRDSSVHAEWVCCMYQFVLTVVYFVCSMCAGCLVQVFSTCIAG